MKTPAFIVVLLLTASAAAAADIRSYDVHLRTSADGTARASVTVALADTGTGRVSIPVGFSGIRDLTLGDAPSGTTLSISPANGQSTVHVLLPDGTPPATTVSFSFGITAAFQDTTPAPGQRSTLPAGSRLLKHNLVNTESGSIGSYALYVTFPAGVRAHAVREWAPKLRKGEAGPRVRLTGLDGGGGARLRVDRLNQGDAAAMLIELVPESRSVGWLIAGLVLSLLYLVSFKDLIGTRAD